MADPSTCSPLTRASVVAAHAAIAPHIHRTPIATSTTLSTFASTPQTREQLEGTEDDAAGAQPAAPHMRLFFKCENQQRVGAFKARGAFHALSRLSDEQLARGVVTHSSGNHAAALSLAARTRGVPAYIVMPSISTPSKIAATRGYGATIRFSGSTAPEREAVVRDVVAETGAVLVPPYDHPDIILGQGTLALEFEAQVADAVAAAPALSVRDAAKGLDAVIAPCGGGGMLSGVATALAGTGIRVFGAEPSFEGADDARRGLKQGRRIEAVKSLTIADGVRTPVGEIPWTVISDKTKVQDVFAVSEDEIKKALRLLMERMKVFVEPTAALGLAVALYNEEFRRLVEREAGEEGWNVGIVLSGGNTTMEAIGKLYAAPQTEAARAEGVVGINGERKAENVAG
ncbi:pyridoxal-phosphate dependent enzyme-domain-containing protein [Phyllosticta citribraziliensis]|uniref:Pyridoxal-phosphate dependent enzyme-domain-containing protein n=1 Tax=Phyllosticta citribraziliensis TaxID=989973 RepID=A0ABR1M3A9_9PEZI